MTEITTFATIAALNQLQRDHLQNTKGRFMQDSNIIANIAAVKQIARGVLKNTKSQCMKETSILANNAHWANSARHTGFGEVASGYIFSLKTHFQTFKVTYTHSGISQFKVLIDLRINFQRFLQNDLNRPVFELQKWALYQNGVEFHQKSIEPIIYDLFPAI